MVEHSKCKTCKKVQHVSLLKKNPEGDGWLCVDVEKCKMNAANRKPEKS